MKRILILTVYSVAVVTTVWFVLPRLGFSKGDRKSDTVETARAEFRPIEEIVHVTGEVVPFQATDIKSEVSGRVSKLNVKAGEHVSAGQVLLELNDPALESESQEANYRVEASRIRQHKAQLDYERKQQLRNKQFVMEKELADAKLELDLAQNALDTDGARLQTIKERLVKTSIRSPHDGTVLNLKVREGLVVIGATTSGEATLLMQVADLNRLQVQSEINEVDVTKISPTMPVSVSFDSVPGTIVPGVVEFVSPSALPKEKDRSIRVFPMTIALQSSDRKIKPGISASVTISTAKNPHALTVSVSAVFIQNSEPYVFVRNGSSFDRRRVTLGINDSTLVEITNGLKEGESVALQHPPAGAVRS